MKRSLAALVLVLFVGSVAVSVIHYPHRLREKPHASKRHVRLACLFIELESATPPEGNSWAASFSPGFSWTLKDEAAHPNVSDVLLHPTRAPPLTPSSRVV